MTTTRECSDEIIASINQCGEDYEVIMYNNHTTNYITVLVTLMKACNYGQNRAKMFVDEAHVRGFASVFWSSKSECDLVGKALNAIGVKVEIRSAGK
jgi:hypothetical protein